MIYICNCRHCTQMYIHIQLSGSNQSVHNHQHSTVLSTVAQMQPMTMRELMIEKARVAAIVNEHKKSIALHHKIIKAVLKKHKKTITSHNKAVLKKRLDDAKAVLKKRLADAGVHASAIRRWNRAVRHGNFDD